MSTCSTPSSSRFASSYFYQTHIWTQVSDRLKLYISGCPILAAYLFLPQGWDRTNSRGQRTSIFCPCHPANICIRTNSIQRESILEISEVLRPVVCPLKGCGRTTSFLRKLLLLQIFSCLSVLSLCSQWEIFSLTEQCSCDHNPLRIQNTSSRNSKKGQT